MEPKNLLRCSEEPVIGPILSQINPRYIHIFFSHLFLSVIFFFSGFSANSCIHSLRSIYPAHVFFCYNNNISRRVKIMKILKMVFCSASCYLLLLSCLFFWAPCFRTSLCVFRLVWETTFALSYFRTCESIYLRSWYYDFFPTYVIGWGVFLGCGALPLGTRIPMFRRDVVPSSSDVSRF